jgi:hypothetical protein
VRFSSIERTLSDTEIADERAVLIAAAQSLNATLR